MKGLREISPTTMKQPPSLSKVWLVLILGSLTAFGPLSMDMYLPALPEVAVDLHTTTSLAQLSLTACLVGLGLGQLVFGPLSDIHGRRKPLTLTLIGYALASFLSAFSPNIWVFVFLRFVQGFTGAAGIVIARASARDMYSGKDLTKFMALLALVNGAAPILAPIFGSFVLTFAPWTGVFHVLGLIGIIMFIAVYFYLPETLPESRRAESSIFGVFRTFGELLRDKAFMSISLAQAFIMGSMFAYIAGSPFILQNMYDVSPQGFAFIFGMNGLGIILFAQLAGWLSSRMEEQNILLGATFVSVFGSVILAYAVWGSPSLIGVLVGLFFIVSSVGAVSTTAFSLAMNAQGDRAGSASAFLGLLPFIAGGIVSPLVGIQGDASAAPLAVIVLVLGIGATIMAFYARRQLAQVK